MQRLTPVDPAHAQGQARELFGAIALRMQRVPNMIRLMGNSPAILQAYLQFNEAFQHTKMTPKLRALLAAAVSELQGCDYTLSVAHALGGPEGVTEADFAAARRLEAEDPRHKAALHFAGRILSEGGHVDEPDIERVREAGYSDEEIVEIIGMVVLGVFRNYFNLVVGSDIDFPLVRSRR